MSDTVKAFFEKTSSQWDTLRQTLYGEEVRDAVIRAVRIGRTDIVLDVGAGTGFLTEAAASVAGRVIALDLSPAMTQEAVTKLRDRGNVEFRLGSAEQIPLDDSSVDVVIGNMVLHHCPNPEVAIREMARVLKPNGRLAISDMQSHDKEWLKAEHADLWLGFEMKEVEKMIRSAGLIESNVEPLSSCCSTEKDGSKVEIPMFLAFARKLVSMEC